MTIATFRKPITNKITIHRKAYIEHIPDQLVQNPSFKPYLVTTRFNSIPSNSGISRQTYRFFTDETWHAYSRLYRHLISNLTKHFTDKPHLHPRTFDFLDVDGTRDSLYATFHQDTIPHVHSIYLVHDQTVERFEELRSDGFRQKILYHPAIQSFVGALHAEPIVPDELPKVVDYASKFLSNHNARLLLADYPLSNQFPDHTQSHRRASYKIALPRNGLIPATIQPRNSSSINKIMGNRAIM